MSSVTCTITDQQRVVGQDTIDLQVDYVVDSPDTGKLEISVDGLVVATHTGLTGSGTINEEIVRSGVDQNLSTSSYNIGAELFEEQFQTMLDGCYEPVPFIEDWFVSCWLNNVDEENRTADLNVTYQVAEGHENASVEVYNGPTLVHTETSLTGSGSFSVNLQFDYSCNSFTACAKLLDHNGTEEHECCDDVAFANDDWSICECVIDDVSRNGSDDDIDASASYNVPDGFTGKVKVVVNGVEVAEHANLTGEGNVEQNVLTGPTQCVPQSDDYDVCFELYDSMDSLMASCCANAYMDVERWGVNCDASNGLRDHDLGTDTFTMQGHYNIPQGETGSVCFSVDGQMLYEVNNLSGSGTAEYEVSAGPFEAVDQADTYNLCVDLKDDQDVVMDSCCDDLFFNSVTTNPCGEEVEEEGPFLGGGGGGVAKPVGRPCAPPRYHNCTPWKILDANGEVDYGKGTHKGGQTDIIYIDVLYNTAFICLGSGGKVVQNGYIYVDVKKKGAAAWENGKDPMRFYAPGVCEQKRTISFHTGRGSGDKNKDSGMDKLHGNTYGRHDEYEVRLRLTDTSGNVKDTYVLYFVLTPGYRDKACGANIGFELSEWQPGKPRGWMRHNWWLDFPRTHPSDPVGALPIHYYHTQQFYLYGHWKPLARGCRAEVEVQIKRDDGTYGPPLNVVQPVTYYPHWPGKVVFDGARSHWDWHGWVTNVAAKKGVAGVQTATLSNPKQGLNTYCLRIQVREVTAVDKDGKATAYGVTVMPWKYLKFEKIPQAGPAGPTTGGVSYTTQAACTNG